MNLKVPRFDGASGQESWRYSSPGALNPSWAVRSDGTILVVENSNSSDDSTLVGIDGNTGLARWRVPIPHSTWEYFNSACSLQKSPDPPTSVGSPMVAPDGSVYMEVGISTRLDDGYNCLGGGVVNKLGGEVLLVQATPEGSPVWSAPISSGGSIPTYSDHTVGEVIPDGQGGLLAGWSGMAFNNVYPYLTHVTASGNFQYAFPQDLGTAGVKSMVLGENGTAFASLNGSAGTQFASFDIASGAVNWTWTGSSGTAEIIASSAGNGLVVRDGTHVTRIDPAGVATPDTWTGNSLQYADAGDWLGLGSFVVYSGDPVGPAANPYTTAGGYKKLAGSQPECAPFDEPQDSMVQRSFSSLMTLLQNPCLNCGTYVFKKLPPSTLAPTITQDAFYDFFKSNSHTYCDISKSWRSVKDFPITDQSTYPIKDYPTIKDYYGKKLGTSTEVDAIEMDAKTHHYPSAFINPALIVTDLHTEAILFHEGLHSWGDWNDGTLCNFVEQPNHHFYIASCWGNHDVFNQWLFTEIFP